MRTTSNKRFFLLFYVHLLVFSIYINTAVAQSPIQQFDDRVMIDIQNTRTPQKTGFMLFMSNSMKYGNIGIPAVMLAGGIIGKNEALRQNSLFVASSTAVSYAFTELIKVIVKRRRPFIQNININPVYRASNYSFPSGHTSSSFATVTALSMAYPKWYIIIPAYAWAGTVGYSRMYLGVHYPTDVGTGALLGVGSAASMMFIKK